MTHPQSTWDIIRKDKRFLAASKEAQTIILNLAREATWNDTKALADAKMRRALDAAFGPACSCNDYGPMPQPERCPAHRPKC